MNDSQPDDEFGDDERYPTDTELRMLREFAGSPAQMVEFLRRHWWSADWGLHVTDGDEAEPNKLGDHGAGRNYRWVHLSTGGWSGNEDRLDALRNSGRMMSFWTRYWHTSRVGGHYLFRIPIEQWDTPIESFALPTRPTPIDDLLGHAIDLLLQAGEHTAAQHQTPGTFIAESKRAAEIRLWRQTFASTAGPMPGIGGCALTDFRVTAIRIHQFIFWHLDDTLAYVTDVGSEGEESYAMYGWMHGDMMMHREIAGCIPDWCPSRRAAGSSAAPGDYAQT